MIATIRPAGPDDVAEILRLIVALAVYEREPEAVETTEPMLREALFGEGAHVHAHVAEADGRIVGIAVWFLNYSTWTGRSGVYLEDLFVEEAARGSGAGQGLLRAVAEEAVARGCPRLEWSVLAWNESAMGFYRSIGAVHKTDWQPWRIEGEALTRLALSRD